MQMQSIAADGLLTISLFGLSILFAEETWFLFAEDMVLIWEYEVCFFSSKHCSVDVTLLVQEYL